MEFRLLGRLEAEHDGRRVELGRRLERCLLAVVLMEAGGVVPVNRLVDLQSEGAPPAAARANVRTHVSRLRSRLNAAAGANVRLVSRHGGYLIDINRREIDAFRFRGLVERARASAQPAARADLLRQAVSLWRGPFLADFAADTAYQRLRDRLGAELTEMRLSATELMVDAELHCGRHREVVAALTALTAEYPYHEQFVSQLMLALYRCHREVDALVAYQRFSHRLADDLGLEPTRRLRELQGAVLRRDARLVDAGGNGDETWAPPASRGCRCRGNCLPPLPISPATKTP
jgi:DNA-binding SARP family transcriptional activator